MYISDLLNKYNYPRLYAKARYYQLLTRTKYKIVDEPLAAAFDWEASDEGEEFWNNVNKGLFTDAEELVADETLFIRDF